MVALISQLQGVIKEKQEGYVVLECNGVGYEILLPKSTLLKLPEIGEPVVLRTHLYVRPEAHSLYGFLTAVQRDMFRILINISKIGPSLALNILSDLSIVDLVACVRYEDPKPLEKVPRLGKATAAKLLIELSGKIDHIVKTAQLSDAQEIPKGDYLTDALAALMTMGFSSKEARHAIAMVRDGADSTEEIIRLALHTLSSERT